MHVVERVVQVIQVVVQEVNHGQLGTGEAQLWAEGPGVGHGTRQGAHDLGGVWALGGQEPSHLWGQLGGRKEFPMQEDFPLVNTVDSEGMRSQSLEVSKQGLHQERAVGLQD